MSENRDRKKRIKHNFATELNFVVHMTDYEYIIQQVKRFHFTKWDENVLRECQSILPNLTREELVSIYRSRLLGYSMSLRRVTCNG